MIALDTSWLPPFVRRYRRPIVILVHVALIVAAYLLSFLLCYDFRFGPLPEGVLFKTLPLVLVVRLGTLGLSHLFQGIWRYASVRDALQIAKATTLGTVIFVPLVWLIFGLDTFPKGVFILDWILNLLMLGGVRLLGRLAARGPLDQGKAERSEKRLLIIGAGDAGAALCREAQNRPEFGLLPVGFIDDDPWKASASVLGVPVLGNRRDIPAVVAEHRVDTIVIAIPSASREQMHDMVAQCRAAGVSFRTLPPLTNLLDRRVSFSNLREIEIADLLGREPVKLDMETIGRFLKGKRVLITGAAGTIGSELARQIAPLHPELMLLVDRAENSLFFFEAEFQKQFAGQPFLAEVHDICDYTTMSNLLRTHRPHVIFHAAAYKHVPLMERVPAEAVRNNVLGTMNLARTAQENGVSTFVFISTDKAVNPTSVMGATKRVAELLLQAMNGNGATKFVAVRFGNVLGSNASVVPIFQEQIARGGPVTVTHPDARRYFMTPAEAAQLVMQAGAMGTGGEIFVLDMGDPVKIIDLARELIHISGHTPDADIKIVITELRPGEKLFEELSFKEEVMAHTNHPKLWILRDPPSQRNTVKEAVQLGQDLPALTPEQVKARLVALVPEYTPEHPQVPVK